MTGPGVGPRASLLATSWWLVRRAGLLVPAGTALLLVLATVPVLDDGWALRVLRGVGVLLACAWVSATDDPAGEVVAASPYPRRVRTLARVGAAFPPLAAVWALAAVVVQVRVPQVPVLALGVEALALGLLGLAVGTGLRAWHDLHRPAHAAALALVLLAFVMGAAPRWYALHQSQTWGPPWEAAQIRWWALGLVGAGLAALALHDPLHRRLRPRRPGSRPRGRSAGPGPGAATPATEMEALVPVVRT